MSQQYLRQVSLVLGDANGVGLDLSEMHIRFDVRNATAQTLKALEVRVYNLSDNTVRTIKQEFTKVFLQAGYPGNMGLIFSGTISKIKTGRENATDTFLEIVAADSDEAYNWSVANSTLAAGWTPATVNKALMQAFQPYQVNQGYIPTFTANPAPRGKVCYGMTRDYFRTLADGQQADWYIDGGQVNIVPKKSVLPGQAIVLTAKTGMIGVPQQTINGIVIRALLNPNIKAGGQIQIDNASVQQTQVNVQFSAADFFPSLDADGYYKAICVSHNGDTRGMNFYTEIICIAVDGTAPIGGPTLTAVPDGH